MSAEQSEPSASSAIGSAVPVLSGAESGLAIAQPKQKRKRRRSPGGLGRGLARILTDNQSDPDRSGAARPGLLQLVGGPSNAKADRIRRFVVDAALQAMVDGFGLDGVVLAAQAPGSDPTDGTSQPESSATGASPVFLAARLPPSWSPESQVLFEVYGNLWLVLQRDFSPTDSSLISTGRAGSSVVEEQWQIPIGRHWVLLSRMDDDGMPVAAVAVREAPFSPEEAEAIGTVVGSVVAACSDTEARATGRGRIRAGTGVIIKANGGPAPDDPVEGDGSEPTAELQAEVTAEWELEAGEDGVAVGGRRIGVGRGTDAVTAVARAAVKACRPRCDLAFAGASELEDLTVSIVMIRHSRNGLRLGYAVRPCGDHTGAAEAVFTAAD